MNVSSFPTPVALPSGAAESSPAASAESAPTGSFESLLSAEPVAPKGSGDSESVESSDEEENIPTQAEQTNLAALLCSLSVQTLPPAAPANLAPQGAVADAWNTAAPAIDDVSTAGATGAFTNPVDGGEANIAALPMGVVGEATPASLPDATSVPALENQEDLSGEAAKSSDLAESGMAVAKAVGAMNDDLVQDQTDSSALPDAGLNTPAAPAGNEPPAEVVEEESPRAEQKAVTSKGRDTAAARPARASVDAPASRFAARTMATPIGDKAPKQPGSELPNNANAPQTKAERGSADAFQSTVSTSFTPVTQTVDAGRAEATVATPKPMAPTALLEEVGLRLEQMQQRGSDRVDLRVALSGGEQVNIELQMRDGAAHVSFHTGSHELRTALEQGWSQLASRSEALGLPLNPPVFKAPSTSGDAAQQEFRERRQEPQQERPAPLPYYPTANLPARRTAVSTAARTSSKGLNLWA